ncbi:hypothetical protein Tco_1365714 [Tanacetum coccineum]
MLVSLFDQIKETIALVFQNYKSLDESSPSGDTSKKSGSMSPAIDPALKLYSLLHDIDRKSTVDQSSYTSGYRKMKSLVINIRNEIVSDIEMHDKQVLPTSQLSNRMRAFLAAYPPVSLSPPITDLIITTCDFHKDLLDWNISPVNDGFDAKALFNMYITKRINDKRLELLESCKLYKWTRFYETPTGYGIAQMATNGNHGKVVYHMREILRLEPRFDDEVLPADENSKVEEAEEKKE